MKSLFNLLGIPVSQFAKELGISRKHWSGIVNNRARPSADLAKKIVTTLQTKIEEEITLFEQRHQQMANSARDELKKVLSKLSERYNDE